MQNNKKKETIIFDLVKWMDRIWIVNECTYTMIGAYLCKRFGPDSKAASAINGYVMLGTWNSNISLERLTL